METNYVDYGHSAAESSPELRADFIRKTYLHLAAAILAFVGLEVLLFSSGMAEGIAKTLMGGRWSWFIVLAAFMGVSMLANWWANSQTSPAMQYLGLGLYVVAEAIIFVPLLYIAANFSGPDVILKAGGVTFALFLGITTVALVTKQDFSFLRPIIMIGGFVALGFILVSMIFGFSLGSVFAFVMVAFAATSILYETSNVMHQYRTDQHVAASLSLFASVALLFWYILQIFNRR
jgi:FtsH-binding integral membrane protein